MGVSWGGSAGGELVDNLSTSATQHVWNKRQLSLNSQPVYFAWEHVRDKRQRSSTWQHVYSMGAPSPAHHLVEGARAFDLKCLRIPICWALGTRSSRELPSVPSGHISPQRPDSLSCSRAEQSLFQPFFSLSNSLPGK